MCRRRSGGLKQSQAQLYESYRQARKPSEGFWIETLFQMQRTNALNWLFPEKVRRVKKQSTKTGRFLLGYMLKNFQRGPWVWARLAYVSFLPHNLVTGGLPHTGSRHFLIVRDGSFCWQSLCACLCSRFSSVWLFATPWTVAHQAPLSMGFSRQQYSLFTKLYMAFGLCWLHHTLQGIFNV